MSMEIYRNYAGYETSAVSAAKKRAERKAAVAEIAQEALTSGFDRKA